jgi:hypothetical protein
LLVDIAGNGGGNDIAMVLAWMVGDPALRAPALSIVKEPARRKNLEEAAADLVAASQGAVGDEARAVHKWLAVLQRAQADAAQACDLSPLWSGRSPGCSQLISGFHAGGLAEGALPAEWRDKAWAEMVSAPASFPEPRVRWHGPLVVLVDQKTASAAELFASMIQDGRRGIIVGAPSRGAGCGWWNMAREDLVLRHSGGRLAIPNCARFRADGRDEIDGVEPEVLVGFRPADTPAQRAQRLAPRLPAAVEAAIANGQHR